MPTIVSTIINSVASAVIQNNSNESVLVTPTGQALSTGGRGIYLEGNNYDITVLGTVWGATAGIYNSENFDFSATNIMVGGSGFVGSDNFAIDSDALFTYVANDGLISGRGGIVADGDTLQVTNNGTIASSIEHAIDLLGSTGLELTNHGAISTNSGSQDSITGFDVSDARIVNYGTITAYADAIDIRGALSASSITNHGTITGRVWVASSSTFYDFAFDNTGLIEEGGVFISGKADFNNSGTINGNVTFSSGDQIFRNTGVIDGSVTLGGGDDTFYLEESETIHDVNGSTGRDTLDLTEFGANTWIDMGVDTAWSYEIWTDDGTVAGPDWRYLGQARNFIDVRLGVHQDTVYGSSADNRFIATDFVPGYGPVDNLYGGNGEDIVDYSRANHAIWFNLDRTSGSVWTKQTEEISSDGTWTQLAAISGIEAAVGTVYVDQVIGSAEDDLFFYDGTLYFAGIEDIAMGDGTDTVDFHNFGSAVWVDLAVTGQAQVWTQDFYDLSGLGNWREIATLTGTENILGTRNSDEMRGDANANMIEGAGGDDLLEGRAGADVFVFSEFDSEGTEISQGSDTILDFEADNAEKIDFSDETEITDFADLVANHIADNGAGDLVIGWGFSNVTLVGWSTADVGFGLAISADDFIF